MRVIDHATLPAMHTQVSRPHAPTRTGSAWPIAIAALAALALGLHGPIEQWSSYHAFADQRSWFGIPRAADVLSNLPFAAIGAWGWLRLAGSAAAPSRLAWRLFCVALVCTSAGSALYHLGPDNTTLVVDRLPIAWACAMLLCAFLAERVDPRWGRAAPVAAALLVGTASVALWWWGDQRGTGDLRAYLYVQFLPMAVIPATLLATRRAIVPHGVPARAWWSVLALYALAKGLEVADHAVFDTIGLVSGHTLKHLVAAAGAAVLVAAFAAPGRSDQLR